MSQFELEGAALDAKVDGYATRIVENCSTIIDGDDQKGVLHSQLKSAWMTGRMHGFKDAHEAVLFRITIIGLIMFSAGIGVATVVSWIL